MTETETLTRELTNAIVAEAARVGFEYPDLVPNLIDARRVPGPASVAAAVAELARARPHMINTSVASRAEFGSSLPDDRRPSGFEIDQEVALIRSRAAAAYRNRF